ncbi:unnamed protein product [Vitrella brassicaformis CCMP3155]|uniref:Uncharacterized protein n=2 Tax=Vitrella brassicaformis TaxID=1169539 RepID=A0A0G4EMG7_VITBC|nr:unnamed protein product [Vitrella brassicaformis CCMP3155]|eukprot:CEL98196.1 unnamed protein product [Vitrella brassicaformis CCMP3155]
MLMMHRYSSFQRFQLPPSSLTHQQRAFLSASRRLLASPSPPSSSKWQQPDSRSLQSFDEYLFAHSPAAVFRKIWDALSLAKIRQRGLWWQTVDKAAFLSDPQRQWMVENGYMAFPDGVDFVLRRWRGRLYKVPVVGSTKQLLEVVRWWLTHRSDRRRQRKEWATERARQQAHRQRSRQFIPIVRSSATSSAAKGPAVAASSALPEVFTPDHPNYSPKSPTGTRFFGPQDVLRAVMKALEPIEKATRPSAALSADASLTKWLRDQQRRTGIEWPAGSGYVWCGLVGLIALCTGLGWASERAVSRCRSVDELERSVDACVAWARGMALHPQLLGIGGEGRGIMDARQLYRLLSCSLTLGGPSVPDDRAHFGGVTAVTATRLLIGGLAAALWERTVGTAALLATFAGSTVLCNGVAVSLQHMRGDSPPLMGSQPALYALAIGATVLGRYAAAPLVPLPFVYSAAVLVGLYSWDLQPSYSTNYWPSADAFFAALRAQLKLAGCESMIGNGHVGMGGVRELQRLRDQIKGEVQKGSSSCGSAFWLPGDPRVLSDGVGVVAGVAIAVALKLLRTRRTML